MKQEDVRVIERQIPLLVLTSSDPMPCSVSTKYQARSPKVVIRDFKINNSVMWSSPVCHMLTDLVSVLTVLPIHHVGDRVGDPEQL